MKMEEKEDEPMADGMTYKMLTDTRDNTTICYVANLTYNQGMWRMADTLTTSLPMFILQLTIMMLLSRFLHLFSRRLRLPLFVSELAAGILMGPSGPFDKRPFFMANLLPFHGNRVLETIANFGIVYYIFLVGLDMDASPVLRTSRKSLALAVSGAAVPAAAAALLYLSLFSGPLSDQHKKGLYFWVIALAVTSFPDITRDLACRKVLHTDLGRTALSTAVVNDLLSWLFLVVAIAFVSDAHRYMAVVSTLGFVALCVFAVRPTMAWLMRQSEKREEYVDYHMCFVLTGVALCGFATELCGSHSIVGAFVFGLVIPSGDLADTLKSRLEAYVAATMLPLFYLISGFRFSTTHLYTAPDGSEVSQRLIVLMVFVFCSVKVVTTFIVSLMFKDSAMDSLVLGLFLNTKGILALIVLNTGRNISALDDQTYTIMAMAILIMTAMPVPATFFLRPRSENYLCRTVQTTNACEGELRVVACIHSTRNVTPLINVLRSVEATKESPMCVYGVHLIELTGRASTMIIMHNANKSKGCSTGQAREDSDHIITALHKYEINSDDATAVHPLTVVSPYNTMHNDIARVAQENRAAMILVPFHKLPTSDGTLKEDNINIRDVNLNILRTAPCSVGILIDRGLGMLHRTDSNLRSYAMFFLGGADDREALAFAWKMSRNPGVSLTVVRFVLGKDAAHFSNNVDINDQAVQKELDDEYITEFRYKNVDEKTVHYVETTASCGNDTISVIKEMESTYKMFIMGKGRGALSALTSGLGQWSDTPELGLLGDVVVQSDFANDVSVLVVQQYNPEKVGASSKEEDKGFDTSILND